MVADISVSVSESLKNLLNSDDDDKYSDYHTASEDFCSEASDSGDESDLSSYFGDSVEFYDSDDEEDVNEPTKTLEEIQMEFDELLKKFTSELDKFEQEMEELKAIF